MLGMIRRLWNLARQTELARHGLLLFLALTLANVSNYVFHVVVSRLLGPRAYGALGALLSAFILISVPVSALQVAVAKRISILRAKGDEPSAGHLFRSMLRTTFLIALGMGGLVAVISPLISDFLKLESTGPTLALAAYVIFAIVGPVVRGALQGRLLFVPLAALAAGTTILRLIAGVALVGLGFGVTGAVVASVLAELAGLVFGLLPLRSFVANAAKGKVSVRGVFKEAQFAMVAFGGFWAVVSLDTLLVRHYFSDEISGFYAAGAVAAHMVLFLSGAVGVVVFPRFAESRGLSVAARKTLFHSIVMVGLLGLGAAAGLSIFRSLVVRLLFGSDYLSGAVVIGTLGLAMALLGITNILIYFHLASNSKALWSLLIGAGLETAGIALFHGSIIQVSLIVLAVSVGLLLFNTIAAYAHPGDPRVQPEVTGELWEPSLEGLDLSVVTPAFNPGPEFRENLEMLFEALGGAGIRYEVIAVSDGSTDSSHQLVKGLTDDSFKLIHYDVHRGKGYALRTGLASARGKYVAFIDSDGDIHWSALEFFFDLMKSHDVDLVIGSKRHPESRVEYPLLRRLMSWAYHAFVRILFGIKLSDTQTGVKLAKRELLAQALPRMLEKRFAFDLELIVVARLLGFRRIIEAPVRLNYKFTSTVSWRTALATAIDTLAIFYRRYILRYYDHASQADAAEVEALEMALPVEITEIH